MQSDAPAPDRTTLEAMTAYLKAHLVKTTAFRSGETFRALSETAVRFNDTRWFWTDDNAKAAELLCEPANYDADPAVADAALDFVLRMSQGAVIQRRGGPAELRVLSTDPAAFRVETAFFIVEGDLTRGIVRHALRFNDGRTTTAATHTGNYVCYRGLGGVVTLDVEDAITSTAVTLEDRAVVLSFTSTLRRRPVLRPERPGRVVGSLTYSYQVAADSPSVALRVTLTPAPRRSLWGVVLTANTQRLNDVAGSYRAVTIGAGGQDRTVRDIPDGRTVLHAGPADYSVVAQEGGSPGFAYALHVLHRDGTKLETIVARDQLEGRLNTLLNRYRVPFARAGKAVTIREDRMLTGGGYYDAIGHYEAAMRAATGGGEADPSMSYDIGAELNAVAVHLLFARTGRYAAPPVPERLAAMTDWYDRHVNRYFAVIRPGSAGDLNRVFTRGIAFVVLSLDCMLRMTGEGRYRTMLETGVELILRLAQPGAEGDFVFCDTWGGTIRYLDCHASCLLALARAARHGDPGHAIARTVAAAIGGIALHTGPVDVGGGHIEAYDGVAMLNRPDLAPHDTGFWTFKIGLVLRALHAVQRAAEAGSIAMTEDLSGQVQLRIARCEEQIAACYRWHGDMLEVVTSRRAGETNSETQPWTALGLVPVVDDEIADLWHPSLRPAHRVG